MPMKRRYTRSEGITERQVDDVIFLVNPENEALYHLSSIGAALWRLLEDETSGEEAANIICQAFPDADPTSVKTDMVKLISELADHQLITRIKE
ncbi:MAG: PqqD family protein [Rhodospirillaceae bacterium]|jgi:hypothetical protein|nr:PqqD family protein [Rhodospirillaceae bacterium]MBT5243348.1 PqqD family protein [Rhodospirillaceae bacterium]MBT5561814.1 PqqD family protein [Rhodospirillaceae bacterium]MBT6240928.1 PqqD family protein [Rhodospirillaceae bacterium]MBT7139113.1 PqqD family protein [Rhodospirillaceae bacterium]